MKRFWTYLLTYLATIGLILYIFDRLDSRHIFTLIIPYPDWTRGVIVALAVLPVIIAFLCTNPPTFLSKKIPRGFKRLHAKPVMEHFIFFVMFQAVLLMATSLQVAIFPQGYHFYLLNLVSSVSCVLTTGLYILVILHKYFRLNK